MILISYLYVLLVFDAVYKRVLEFVSGENTKLLNLALFIILLFTIVTISLNGLSWLITASLNLSLLFW